jgi:hypothetical protein
MDTTPSTDSSVIEWLLDSDPSIRWQVMRDLLDVPESEWMAERARIESEGWGARLLAHEDDDGQWAGGAFFPHDFTRELWESEGQPWTATTYALSQLREFGLDPTTDRARRMVELVRANSVWDHDGQPFWDGEVEECINGRTLADGAYFGVDMSALVERLVSERLEDGAWNCERANGSLVSSIDTTINVLEGLLEFERATGGTDDSIAARRSGEEYLLKRNLYRRLSNGEPADEDFLKLIHPNRWRHDVLRGLEYFRAAGLLTGTGPDPRLGDPIDYIVSRRSEDGRWPLDWDLRGRSWFDVDDGEGNPSKWVTLRALRVLRWWGDAPGES